MSFYEDFLSLGYKENEAIELAHIAEECESEFINAYELDEATIEKIADAFNGCTSFQMKVEDLANVVREW